MPRIDMDLEHNVHGYPDTISLALEGNGRFTLCASVMIGYRIGASVTLNQFELDTLILHLQRFSALMKLEPQQ